MKPLIRTFALIAVAAALSLTGCNSKQTRSTINHEAAVNGPFPHRPLGWKVITSWVNNRNQTMSTLYGNEVAVRYARSNAAHDYPAGSILALVTWAQRDDPHWFGAKIPSTPQSVEFVTVPLTSGALPTYQRYQGTPLSLAAAAAGDTARIDYLIAQRAAVMP